jgi:hypothetical protein
MAGDVKPKRKALHRGIADAINKDASATSLLLNKVQPRALRSESVTEQHTIAPDAIVAQGAIAQPTIAQGTIAPEKPLLSHGAIVAQGAIAQHAIVPEQYTRVPNGIFDSVMKTLDVYDQAILLRLYRLSRGYHKETCTVGYQTLAKACNISSRQAQKSVERLIDRGWIERLSVEQGGSKRSERGSVYKVNLPAATIAPRATIAQPTIARGASNKESFKKETNKGERELSLDTKNCPDCQGSGFWYPEGVEKGVAKCKHERLGEVK